MNVKLYMADEGHIIAILQSADGTIEYICLKTDSTMLAGVLANLLEQAPLAAAHECGLIGYAVGEVSSDTLPDRFGYLKTILPDQEHQIRVINERYQTLFFLTDGSNMAIETPTKDFVGKVHYIDPCHFRFAGLTYHFCQFAEMCVPIAGRCKPEPIVREGQAAWKVAGKGYFMMFIRDDESYDYSFYDEDLNLLDGGVIETASDFLGVRDELLDEFDWNDRLMEVVDYDEISAQAEEAAVRAFLDKGGF